MPGETVYHIEFINVKTRERRVTYVEERFKNYNHWREIITNHPKGQIVSNLTIYNGRRIDADSKPTIEYLLPQHEMQQLLDEQWGKL